MNNNRNKINGNFSFIKNNGKSNGKENKIIGIVSAKGGVGKTTTTINLGAAALSTFNKSVLLLDTNLDTGNLALHLGLSSHPTSIEQITRDSLSILDSIHKHKSGLHVVPSPFIAEDKKVDAVALKKKLKALKKLLFLSNLAEKTTIFSLFASQPCELTKNFFFEPSPSLQSRLRQIRQTTKIASVALLKGETVGFSPRRTSLTTWTTSLTKIGFLKNWV